MAGSPPPPDSRCRFLAAGWENQNVFFFRTFSSAEIICRFHGTFKPQTPVPPYRDNVIDVNVFTGGANGFRDPVPLQHLVYPDPLRRRKSEMKLSNNLANGIPKLAIRRKLLRVLRSPNAAVLSRPRLRLRWSYKASEEQIM